MLETDMQYNVGDRVTMLNVWKYDKACGIVDKITKDYVVVRWDNIPGYWHYTEEQAKRLELVDVTD
tara:strand:- start:1186 stop:1383 length:198 start_codon:yes stop_codon:yes gene_type:complete